MQTVALTGMVPPRVTAVCLDIINFTRGPPILWKLMLHFAELVTLWGVVF